MVSASVFFKGRISRKHSTGTPSSSQRKTQTILPRCALICYEAVHGCFLKTLQIDSSTHVPIDSMNLTTATLDVYTAFLGAVSRNCFKSWLPHRTTTSTSFSNLRMCNMFLGKKMCEKNQTLHCSSVLGPFSCFNILKLLHNRNCSMFGCSISC